MSETMKLIELETALKEQLGHDGRQETDVLTSVPIY
jgi:hypothetical protein